jgi:hypothetical protein
MNNKAIKTYEDLLQEEQRLTTHLATYKDLIKEDIAGVKQGVKDKLNPVKKAKEKVLSLFSQEGRNGPALNFGINFVLDYIIRIIIPKQKSIWTKTVIPFITKNYVSHLITDKQRTNILNTVNNVVGKVDHFIRKKIMKKQDDHFRAVASAPAAPAVNPGYSSEIP